MRLPWFGEFRWGLASKLLLWAFVLMQREMRVETVQAFHALSLTATPDPLCETVSRRASKAR